MEKVMWLRRHRRTRWDAPSNAKGRSARPSDNLQSWGQPSTTVVRDTRDNSTEQPWSGGWMQTQRLRRGSGLQSPSPLAWGEAALPLLEYKSIRLVQLNREENAAQSHLRVRGQERDPQSTHCTPALRSPSHRGTRRGSGMPLKCPHSCHDAHTGVVFPLGRACRLPINDS